MKNLFKKLFKRNIDASVETSTYVSSFGTDDTWTLENAVDEGYKKSTWVYRAVRILADAVSSVPWYVVNDDGEYVENHHLTELFMHPNGQVSKQDLFEMITMWLQLDGNSYLNAIKVAGKTSELWPLSPDKMEPEPSTQPGEWIARYRRTNKSGGTAKYYEPDEIIHHKNIDPAKPYKGFAPLEVSSEVVDIDTSQKKYNYTTSSGGGALKGVFSFAREFHRQDEADTVAKRLEKSLNKDRWFTVLGGNAKFSPINMSPAEMDYIESRKFNREEIAVVFGVPLPLIASDVMTYNNYQTSEEILWSLTVIPLLENLLDGFNSFFRPEMAENEKIVYDISNVPAVRRMTYARAETADKLFKMGVPFSQLNEIFGFGVSEYPGWDQSYVGNITESTTVVEDERTEKKKTFSIRAIEEDELEKRLKPKAYEKLLELEKNLVFPLIDSNQTEKIEDALKVTEQAWIELIGERYQADAEYFAKQTDIVVRQDEPNVALMIEEYLASEAIVLTEQSLIATTTVNEILKHVREGLGANQTVQEIKESIVDAGIFEPERALRIARTITGTAGSIGQYQAGISTGATHKRWVANPGARDEHKNRNGEIVSIDGRFSPQVGSYRPEYPLDQKMAPKDRINCRCSMTFELREQENA